MSMDDARRFWSDHKMAAMSFAISITDVLIVWIVEAVGLLTRAHLEALYQIQGLALVLGTLAAILFAGFALMSDSKPMLGVFALVAALGVFFFNGMAMGPV